MKKPATPDETEDSCDAAAMLREIADVVNIVVKECFDLERQQLVSGILYRLQEEGVLDRSPVAEVLVGVLVDDAFASLWAGAEVV